MHPNAEKRQQLLTVLYQAREAQAANKIKDGWISEADLKNAVGDLVGQHQPNILRFS